MKKYKVTGKYLCTVEVEVEAESEDDAEYMAQTALDELAAKNVHAHSITVEEITV